MLKRIESNPNDNQDERATNRKYKMKREKGKEKMKIISANVLKMKHNSYLFKIIY